MRHTRFSLTHSLRLAVVLVAGLVLAMTMISVVAFSAAQIEPLNAPGGITGTLYEPDTTTTVADGWIDIHDIEGNPWMGTVTAGDGSYSIANLPPGEYILSAYPPEGSAFAASLPAVVEVLSGQMVSQDLLLTEVRISGWVQDCDTGARIEGALVVAHNEDWSVEQWSGTNINGEYKIGGVNIGVTYFLEVLPPEGSEYVPLPIEYTAVPIATDVVLELCIPPENVVGVVHNYLGAPVPDAGVVIFRDDFWAETGTDPSGAFLFRGLPLGEFWIQAAPPWGELGQGLLSSSPFTVTIPTSTTLEDVGIIVLPQAVKTATGQVVVIGTPDPVPNAVVEAHRLDRPGFVDTPVDATGSYTLYLPGGEWHLRAVPPPPPSPPAEWIFHEPPAWIAFQQPYSIPEHITDVNLEVIPTNAWVEGNILCPDGPDPDLDPDPCTADIVPPEDIWVELRHDEIGNGGPVGPDYRFAIPVPDGWYELFVHVGHPHLQGPAPIEVYANPGWQSVPDLVLLPKDATIIGRVHDEFGMGVGGVHVAGWQPEGFGWGWAETDASGVYTMPVIPGEWFVEPQPDPDMPFVYRHRPRLARVAPRGTMDGVDFMLTFASARIQGTAVEDGDPSQERLWGLDGWASAHVLPTEAFFSDAPMWDGGFELKAKGGYTYAVGLHLPPYAPFVSGGYAPVPVAPGGLATVMVPLKPKDAAIEGRLIISGTPDPALGVWAEVFGEDEAGHWTVARVDEDTAEYRMEVAAGTWHLRAWVDPHSGYAAPPVPKTVIATSGPPAILDFEVVPIDSFIEGQVLQPDGVTPMSMTHVFAEGESPFIGHFEAHAETDPDGYFHLPVPLGEYVVGAGLPPSELEARGWLNPPPIEGVIPPITGLYLQFRAIDGNIQGTIDFASGLSVVPTHPAYVWGRSDNGEWMETEALTDTATTFAYVLPTVSGSVWHVGAVYEDPENGQFYESAEVAVDLTSVTHETQDLTLSGPYTMPQPIIITFDGSYMQHIVLPGHVELSIPPGAIVVSGTVTLFIFPTHEMPPEPGREIIGTGYEMWAVDQNGQEITHFNQNVMMIFHYPPDSVLQAHGVSEHMLVPVYYSTLAGHWILADSYVVDTNNNEITLQINHFTKLGVCSTEPQRYQLYLPTITKNFQ